MLLCGFLSAFLGEPVDAVHAFEIATALKESGIRPPFPTGFYGLVSDFGLFSVLTGS